MEKSAENNKYVIARSQNEVKALSISEIFLNNCH